MNKIQKYFPELTKDQLKKFQDLEGLYQEWNSKINVISRKDMDHFYERHVLHSLSIAKFQQFLPDQKILDVGTGGGFPGIPLAVLFPESSFFLVDSIGKKIKVVNEVANSLGLKNVSAQHVRAEDIQEKFDFVLSRAVTRLKPFYDWINKKIKKSSPISKSGILYLKGGDLEEELAEVSVKKEIVELSSIFDEDFFKTKKLIYIPF